MSIHVAANVLISFFFMAAYFTSFCFISTMVNAIQVHILLNQTATLRTQIFAFRCCWAAAAKSLQSCPTLCDPIDGSPPGFPVPGILQARILEWVAISFRCYFL